MAKYCPRQKTYTRKAHDSHLPKKERACLGHDCQAKIVSRYPGLCPNCKARIRMANDNVTEYEAPHGHGLKSAREGY